MAVRVSADFQAVCCSSGADPRSYLYTENDRGDVTYFNHYNLRVIVQAIKDLHAYLERQQKKISEAARLLRSSPDLNHRQQSLIYHALKTPRFYMYSPAV